MWTRSEHLDIAVAVTVFWKTRAGISRFDFQKYGNAQKLLPLPGERAGERADVSLTLASLLAVPFIRLPIKNVEEAEFFTPVSARSCRYDGA